MAVKSLAERLRFVTRPLDDGDHGLYLSPKRDVAMPVGYIEKQPGGRYRGRCAVTGEWMDPRPNFKQCRDDLINFVKTGMGLVVDIFKGYQNARDMYYLADAIEVENDARPPKPELWKSKDGHRFAFSLDTKSGDDIFVFGFYGEDEARTAAVEAVRRWREEEDNAR